ncbi:uncharacterized protein LOC118791563 isoform X1 [Megalops cyprinoides]|uniref:uncharacterized protein LOC118791563 isoform X1 n=2 Tax=Megalops cyprinoides TaxID=118141 RepID=UPI0018645AB3|nr:uncharacterized protein LOC118791563 isoform X1 [Megalops cyprinoides]
MLTPLKCMGRHQENPVRLYFSYDRIANKSRCQIEGCTAEIAGNHGGNLQRHVQRMHPLAFARLPGPLRPDNPTVPLSSLSPSSSSTAKRPGAAADVEVAALDPTVTKRPRGELVWMTVDSLREACVELVTSNGRPFSLMDDSGFRKILDPVLEALGEHVVISSGAVRNMVLEAAERERERLRGTLRGRPLMLKVDAAMLRGRSVLGVHVQYTEGEGVALRTLAVRELCKERTDSYVASVVREVLKLYDIQLRQLYAITTDNGIADPAEQDSEAQHERAGRKEGDEAIAGGLPASGRGDGLLALDIYETPGSVAVDMHGAGGGGPVLRGVRCSAHVFHAAVGDVLWDGGPAGLVAKMRRISEELLSPNVSAFLTRLGHRSVALDCPASWMSTHDMLERLCELRAFCQDMAPSAPVLHLTEAEWDNVGLLVRSLHPARAMADALLAEQLTAGDFFGAWLKCKIETDKVGGPFAALLVECLSRRQHALFENEAFLAAVFLDPRYKVLLSDAQTERAKSHLCSAWGMIQALAHDMQGQGDANDEIEQMLRARERENSNGSVKCKMQMMSVLNAYASEARLKREENIFRYWSSASQSNMDLCKLAVSVLPLPVTQVSVERAFSALRYMLSLKTGIEDDILEDILFVRLNKQFGV